MEYRVGLDELMTILGAWDQALPIRGKIHLIACGGTALTLLGYKESTKDVDLLVPNETEFEKLIHFLRNAGYELVTNDGWKRPDESIIFDLYAGNKIYTTELLSSPLIKGGNKTIKEWNKIYLGVINPMDLIISKMFRGTQVDIDDSLILLKNEKVDLKELEKRYKKTAQYDVSEAKTLKNFERLLHSWKKGLKS